MKTFSSENKESGNKAYSGDESGSVKFAMAGDHEKKILVVCGA